LYRLFDHGLSTMFDNLAPQRGQNTLSSSTIADRHAGHRDPRGEFPQPCGVERRKPFDGPRTDRAKSQIAATTAPVPIPTSKVESNRPHADRKGQTVTTSVRRRQPYPTNIANRYSWPRFFQDTLYGNRRYVRTLPFAEPPITSPVNDDTVASTTAPTIVIDDVGGSGDASATIVRRRLASIDPVTGSLRSPSNEFV
jgi:hypothetical protein